MDDEEECDDEESRLNEISKIGERIEVFIEELSATVVTLNKSLEMAKNAVSSARQKIAEEEEEEEKIRRLNEQYKGWLNSQTTSAPISATTSATISALNSPIMPLEFAASQFLVETGARKLFEDL